MCDLELKDVVDVSKSLVPCIVKASEKMQSAQLKKTYMQTTIMNCKVSCQMSGS